ncbi:hypothetical protein WFK_00135 [Escherichia phage vB_EcoM_WFK]|nr:hypothetical protein WFL6982_00135 [Escherichia phage vB_EcoM_WFL6982]QBQ77159.1 hypothetical protein WFK_00135 [Escherichia phage vB_EcoM_WFK]
MSICKHCNMEFDISNKPKGWMANHTRWCKSNPKLELYKESSKSAIAAMNKARIASGNLNQYVVSKKTGVPVVISEETRQKLSAASLGREHSEEARIKISNARKKWLNENPDKHPWKKNTKFKSVPCEFLKSKLIENGISFIEEYQPVKNRAYCTDIALIDKKIIIEVNGNQHYSNPKKKILAPYYKERHDIIKSLGWEIYELHYAEVYKEDIVNNLIASIV